MCKKGWERVMPLWKHIAAFEIIYLFIHLMRTHTHTFVCVCSAVEKISEDSRVSFVLLGSQHKVKAIFREMINRNGINKTRNHESMMMAMLHLETATLSLSFSVVSLALRDSSSSIRTNTGTAKVRETCKR